MKPLVSILIPHYNYIRWVPTAIERRIIRDAVDWRLREYIRGRLHHALRQNTAQRAAETVAQVLETRRPR